MPINRKPQGEFDFDELARRRGLRTPQEEARRFQQEALRGETGRQVRNIGQQATEGLIGQTSALAARGLGGGVQTGLLSGLERARQGSLTDLKSNLFTQGQLAGEQQRSRLNEFNALVSGINTADLGDINQVGALRGNLQQAIATGAVTPGEQTALSELLSGRQNRFNVPSTQGVAGLQITPEQLGSGNPLEEFFAGLTGRGGRGITGFAGDVASLGIPQALRGVKSILGGGGSAEDFLNIALAALPLSGVGGALGRGAAGLGRGAGRRAITRPLAQPLKSIGVSSALPGLAGAGTRGALGSGLGSVLRRFLT